MDDADDPDPFDDPDFWEAWHNPSCPDVEETVIDTIVHCHTPPTTWFSEYQAMPQRRERCDFVEDGERCTEYEHGRRSRVDDGHRYGGPHGAPTWTIDDTRAFTKRLEERLAHEMRTPPPTRRDPIDFPANDLSAFFEQFREITEIGSTSVRFDPVLGEVSIQQRLIFQPGTFVQLPYGHLELGIRGDPCEHDFARGIMLHDADGKGETVWQVSVCRLCDFVASPSWVWLPS